jgi:hypothetical protein
MSVTVLLALIVAVVPAAAAAAGLTLTADTATLDPAGTSVVLGGPTLAGRSPPAVPTGA